MILELNQVEKRYKGFALNCSMEIREGCVTGLIGANGTGKTTTFKAILDLIRPDGGEIKVFGKNIRELTLEEKAQIGVVLPEGGFNDFLKVKQFPTIMRNFYPGFQSEFFEKRCRELQVPMDKKVREFSSGMKAKLKIILAVSCQARLLILDEPTAGLDVVARDQILELLREFMEEEGRSILISSHISSDLEGLCDDIYMIHDGKIVLHEDTDVILNKYGLLKVSEELFGKLDKKYILRAKKEAFGYSCLTGERDFYQENYPEIVVEKGSVDEVITLMVKGEKL